MDEPKVLVLGWKLKNVMPARRETHDDLWIYGLLQVYDPLNCINMPQSVIRKIVYAGYLRYEAPEACSVIPSTIPTKPHILVTAGGGGDLEALNDWLLQAGERVAEILHPALIVFGPFMQPEFQGSFLDRVKKLDLVRAITFNARIENLIERGVGVVPMGGYNTFCEISSFEKPGIIIARTQPRLE